MCRIDVHARLLILRKKIPLHVYFSAFIRVFALHVFLRIFPPARLFGPIRLFGTLEYRKTFFRGTMNCLTHALQPCSKLKGEIYICSGLVQSVSSAVAAIHNEVELFVK